MVDFEARLHGVLDVPAFCGLPVALTPGPLRKGSRRSAVIRGFAGRTMQNEAEMIEFCRSHLARFKVPRAVVFGELPKTSTGKIQKFLLRDKARSTSAIDT